MTDTALRNQIKDKLWYILCYATEIPEKDLMKYAETQVDGLIADIRSETRSTVLREVGEMIGKVDNITIGEALAWSDKHRKLSGDGVRVVHIKQLLTKYLSDLHTALKAKEDEI